MQSRQASRSRHSFSSVIILQSIADAGLSQYMSCRSGSASSFLRSWRIWTRRYWISAPGINPPNLLQQLAMCQNYSGMEGKLLKYIIFPCE